MPRWLDPDSKGRGRGRYGERVHRTNHLRDGMAIRKAGWKFPVVHRIGSLGKAGQLKSRTRNQLGRLIAGDGFLGCPEGGFDPPVDHPDFNLIEFIAARVPGIQKLERGGFSRKNMVGLYCPGVRKGLGRGQQGEERNRAPEA